MTVQITFNSLAGGTTGSGIYTYGIPSGFTIKSSAFGLTPTNGGVIRYDSANAGLAYLGGTSVGSGYIQHRANNTATVCVLVATNSTLVLYGTSATNNNTNYQGSNYYPFSLSGIMVSFTATFPID